MIFDLNVPHIWKLIFDNLRTEELCNLCKADARFIPAVEEYFYSETKDKEHRGYVSRRVASLSPSKFKLLGFLCNFPAWRTELTFIQCHRLCLKDPHFGRVRR